MQQERHALMECPLCAGHWSLLNPHLWPLRVQFIISSLYSPER